MHVFQVDNAELIESITQQAKEAGVTDGAIVSLIGAAGSFTVSTMPADDASADVVTDYGQPAEMLGTGEIVNGAVHIHATMAVAGDLGVSLEPTATYAAPKDSRQVPLTGKRTTRPATRPDDTKPLRGASVTATAAKLTAARPWGISRLAPYPTTVQLPHATVTVDPATQLGVFRDRAGQVVEMGKHGTSSGTETSTTTNSDSDSDSDSANDQDSNQD
ncbi:putative ATP-grasp target RiPP [Kitasatospora sp. MAP5-34]|nr:putative ATP-grasp target RiPP [Kitasatospora sp. MAP5-34]